MTPILGRVVTAGVYVALALVIAVGATVLGLRYWVLPDIERYRDDIAARVSQAVGAKVSIGAIRADWAGLRPRLELERVQVFDAADNASLELIKVEATLSWRTLLAQSLRLSALTVVQPTLEIRRDVEGRLFVAGLPVDSGGQGGGLSSLVLQTRSVTVRGALVSWEDEARGAPPLVFEGVSLRLENRGSRHRFGLTATPPAALAGHIDLRGDLRGKAFSAWRQWTGKLYLAAPYADAGAWQSRLPALPKHLLSALGGARLWSGRGGTRLWATIDGAELRSLLVDFKLADTVARWDETLPPLEVAALSGRIRYSSDGSDYSLQGSQLSLTTGDDSAAGPARFGTTDFTLRGNAGENDQPGRGELAVNQMDLAAWASLTKHVPLEPELRQRIADLAPKGTVSRLQYAWTGEITAPQRYSLSGQIAQGGLRSADGYPGVAGLAGNVEANERGGAVAVDSLTKLDLPKVFATPIVMAEFKLQVKWRHGEKATELDVGEARFANADLAGSASGTWQAVAGSAGKVDIDGRLSRFDGQKTGLYLPRIVGDKTRAWIERAVVQAKADDVRLRLVGNLRDFPFANDRNGQFLLSMKLQDGVLDYAEGWPRIDGIRADLAIHGHALTIKASDGVISGARLSHVTASIADLKAVSPLLEVQGEANGPFADKLRFINESPVRNKVGAFTESLVGRGEGKLKLGLAVPLHDASGTKVTGDYEFRDASFDLGASVPRVTAINGHLLFSEHGVQGQGITGRLFDGALTADVATAAAGEIVIEGRGNASMAPVRAFLEQPLLGHVTGAADWQGRLALRRGQTDLRITSPLRGVASDLPAPVGKSAGEEMAFSLQRRSGGGEPENIRLAVGRTAFAEIERAETPASGAPASGRRVFKRGIVSFGKAGELAAGPGLWVTGELAALDLDRWRRILGNEKSASDPAVGGETALAGIDLRVGKLDVVDRSFADLHVVAGPTTDGADGWTGSLNGADVAGSFVWKSGGLGKSSNEGSLQARLQRLFLPAKNGTPIVGAAVGTVAMLPALDVQVEDMKMLGENLGRVELLAAPQGMDWRIERLLLARPDATLHASGVWSRGGNARTALQLKLSVPDAGLLLNSFGFSEQVRRGAVELTGELDWAGAPQQMQLKNLSGHLNMEASDGQFLRAKQGAGRLLGLISLEALPRRIALDFRDIFGEGYAWDTIRGDMRITHGLVATDALRIDGQAAKMEIAGEVSLVHETQQLVVKVIPTLGEGVAIASALLGGPVAGVTAYLLQKALQDPINRAAASEYSVTGTWDNPEVSRAERNFFNDSK